MMLLGLNVRGSIGVLLAMAAPVCFGCSNKVVEEDGGGGAATTSAGPSTTAPASGTGKGSTATGTICDATNDATAGASVTFSVVNKGFEPIYLPTNCGAIIYALRDLDEPSDTTFPGYRSCLQTCEDLRTSGRLACGACAPESYRLAPGQTVTVAWDGLGLLSTTMPLSCFQQPDDGEECQRLVAARLASSFEVSFQGYRSCEGDCACDVDGYCSGPASGQLTFPNGVSFELASASVVEVAFDSCAFGCPGD